MGRRRVGRGRRVGAGRRRRLGDFRAATGGDTIEFTITAVDADGNTLPLKILSSVARAPQGGPPTAAQPPVVLQPFVDDGTSGDAQAGDGAFSARSARR